MKNRKGFTLVELLATIVVLSLVIGITAYVVINAIGSAKEKSYKVTVKELESNASNYLLENNGRLFFLTSQDGTYEYQCVTVENLIDYGYLSTDITESKVSENENVSIKDYVYIERDINTKAITKSIYTKTNSEYLETCGKAVIALGDISIAASPSFTEWSTYKNVTITYRLKNLNDQRTLEDYQFNHSYSANNEYNASSDTLENNIKTKQIKILANGKLDTSIKLDSETLASSSVTIEKIDTVGPVIAKGNYTGSAKVRHSVTIPLKVSDFGSGIDHSTFTKDDIEVNVGSSKVTNITLTKVNDDNYNLVVNSDAYNGKITLKIAKDKVLDNLKNGNEVISIDTGVTFDNTYKITYNGNGGSGAPGATSYVYASSGNIALSSTKPSRTGYTFLGWSTSSSATSATYSAGGGYPRNVIKDVTLYAVWKANTYTITYNANGGSGAPGRTSYVYASSGTVALSSTKPSRTGYTFLGWSTSSSATSATYSAGGGYPRNVIKDVTLYAVWKANTYTITYNANGGSGAPGRTSYVYASSGTVALSSTKPSRTGYTFLGWSTSSSATSASYSPGQAWSRSNASNYTLYAVWVKACMNNATITLNNNGASWGCEGTKSVTATCDAALPKINIPCKKYGLGYCGRSPWWSLYEFKGYYDADGVQYYDSKGNSVRNWDKTSNITIYAKWGCAATFGYCEGYYVGNWGQYDCLS